jgi:hypothetical protein
MAIFKEPFASLIKEMGSPTKVAAAVGCTEATMIKWSTGKAKPSGDYQIQVVKLCIERGIDYDVKDDSRVANVMLSDLASRISKLEESSVGNMGTRSFDEARIAQLEEIINKYEAKFADIQASISSLKRDQSITDDEIEALQRKIV